MDHGGNQNNGTRNMKNEAFYKKTLFLKIFEENACLGVSFVIQMQAYSPATLLKRHSNTDVFLTVIAKLLTTAILKNICEQLVLRVFLLC